MGTEVRRYGIIGGEHDDVLKLAHKLQAAHPGTVLKWCWRSWTHAALPCAVACSCMTGTCILVCPSKVPRKPGERVKTRPWAGCRRFGTVVSGRGVDGHLCARTCGRGDAGFGSGARFQVGEATNIEPGNNSRCICCAITCVTAASPVGTPLSPPCGIWPKSKCRSSQSSKSSSRKCLKSSVRPPHSWNGMIGRSNAPCRVGVGNRRCGH